MEDVGEKMLNAIRSCNKPKVCVTRNNLIINHNVLDAAIHGMIDNVIVCLVFFFGTFHVP